jgi:hypothetical protein
MRNGIIVIIELIAFVVLILLGVLWIIKPAENFEPFFALTSLVLVGVELQRRKKFQWSYLMRQSNKSIPSPLEIADNEFIFLEKLSKLSLPDGIYYPEDQFEMGLCNLLSNKGFFIKQGDEFQLTDLCSKFLIRLG